MECRITIQIPWQEGLHIRPAVYIVKLLQPFSSDVQFIKDGSTCNAKSVIQILALGVQCGEALTIEAKGTDAPQALKSLEDYFKQGLW